MIVLENKGEIDPRCFKTFGVSVKEGDNPIGEFGTGLKYALSIIIRTGGEATIWSGLKEHRISSKNQKIRGKAFEMVTCNGRQIGYTTHLGKNWEPWMALRELICNCVDEDGKHYIANEAPKPEKGKTIIAIRNINLEAIYENELDTIFLSSPAVHTSDSASIHEGKGRIYYRGILIENRIEALFDYNIKRKLDLTEDRTARYAFQYEGAVADAWATCKNKKLLRRFFLESHEKYERDLSYGLSSEFSEEFKEIAIEVWKKSPDKINQSLVQRLSCEFTVENAVELTVGESKKLQKAIDFLEQMGFDSDPYEILTVPSLGNTVLAMAKPLENKIILSRTVFNQGTKQLCSTLLEEILHIRDGFSDCSRQLQTYLFDLVITFAEEAKGDIL